MTFKVGDRVTCVDPCSGSAGPQKGHTYTVKGVVPSIVENSGGFIMEVGDIGSWFSSRFVLATEAPKPHKWAKEIIAWANGAEIEVRTKVHTVWSSWIECLVPSWTTIDRVEYRIKPEKKPDVVREVNIVHTDQRASQVDTTLYGVPNARITFDGETGKLKAVELIKE